MVDCGRIVYFHQTCPVCGRTLEIGVHLLGRTVYCQHCGGGFVALDDSLRAGRVVSGSADTSRRVDALLERAALMLARSADDDERA